MVTNGDTDTPLAGTGVWDAMEGLVGERLNKKAQTSFFVLSTEDRQ